jgi:hypothetical protein
MAGLLLLRLLVDEEHPGQVSKKMVDLAVSPGPSAATAAFCDGHKLGDTQARMQDETAASWCYCRQGAAAARAATARNSRGGYSELIGVLRSLHERWLAKHKTWEHGKNLCRDDDVFLFCEAALVEQRQAPQHLRQEVLQSGVNGFGGNG